MLLELKNICKNYKNGSEEMQVLKSVSLSVDEGDYLAIMGPSGSGKSTLMNIIGCLDKPTSGEYHLDGTDILSLDENGLSEIRTHKIGFVFQHFQLLPGETAIQNVMLCRVGLEERVDFLPSQLSGGQKQRVAVARALVNNPSIILADEPTGALDQKSGKTVMELFEQLNNEGVTIVIITHDRNVGSRAKKLLHIVDGEILEHKKEAEHEEA